MAESNEPRLHPILTNEEVKAAREKARKKVEAERKAAELARIESDEADRIRRELNIGDETVEDDVVDITINLPLYVPRLLLNMNDAYYHGQTYRVPRHVERTLREMMQRAHRHDDLSRLGMKLSEHYQKHRETELSGGGVRNAPQRVA